MTKPAASEVTIPYADYRRKVRGCWLGKAVGGTLGAPYEGQDGPHALRFYDPVPSTMLPNDDLDLQVVFLEEIRRRGLPVERRLLADAWQRHIRLYPDEYGVALRNLASGIYPPASGSFDNGFTAGMGAAIRTELWACLAPGDPELAAALAREDACVDHVGEGIHAAVFMATLGSLAFICADREALLEQALAAIPPVCRVARAVAETRMLWEDEEDCEQVREEILLRHGRQNFTDVAQNLSFIVLGWLAGKDFSEAICAAVNCGRDTDCTGASLGALLGIINPDGIGAEWLEPIGEDLSLSPGIVGLHPPADLEELTDQVAELALTTLDYYASNVRLEDAPERGAAASALAPPRLAAPDGLPPINNAGPPLSLLAVEPLIVAVGYPQSLALAPEQEAPITCSLHNPTGGKVSASVSATAPDGWQIEGGPQEVELAANEGCELTFTVRPPPAASRRAWWNALRLRLTANGLSWELAAALPQTIPWQRWLLGQVTNACPEPDACTIVLETPGHTVPVQPGAWAYLSCFKMPLKRDELKLIVQAPGPLKVWLDGELVNEHDGRYRVPALHRCRHTGVQQRIAVGWRRLTVATACNEPGEMFVGLGRGGSGAWLDGVEWRLP